MFSKRVLVASLGCLLSFAASLGEGLHTGSGSAWELRLEEWNKHQEEPSRYNRNVLSPSEIGRRRQASLLFNGRLAPEEALVFGRDWFDCVEGSAELFEGFTKQFNRTFDSNRDRLNRWHSFQATFNRSILLNRVIQNEILNTSNYADRKLMKNYHFIWPLAEQRKVALWYADINDCELGLMKKTVFNIFHAIDSDNLGYAYKLALDESEHLPLLESEGFEQVANILLVKLFDRFEDNRMVEMLFTWPIYLKKLVAYAYNRRQLQQADFKHRMSLIKFAYPNFYKDVKYNVAAFNRTLDNLNMNQRYERFIKMFDRRIGNRSERNKRLQLLRRRLSLLDILNDNPDDWRNSSQEWYKPVAWDGKALFPVSGKLVEANSQADRSESSRLEPTRFSDLSDEEFVAYITNDYSQLTAKDSAGFLESNFPVQPLSNEFKAELARELELRHSIIFPMALEERQSQQQVQQPRSSLAIARRVLDELIADGALPVGPQSVKSSQEELASYFQKVLERFNKPYDERRSPNLLWRDERVKRLEQFKTNLARFQAWFRKEGWPQEESDVVQVLRLADLSWNEIKLTLFRICCLTNETLAELATNNATIAYLGTSNQFLCRRMTAEPETRLELNGEPAKAAQQRERKQQSELAALELYFYYCLHFSKHHTDLDSFNKRFATFRQNVDHIRRHSCTRGLTLFKSLQLRLPDTMSDVDLLDPQRSATDDINLDRFSYFSVAHLRRSEQDLDQTFARSQEDSLERDASVTFAGDSSSGLRGRAEISYGRESFFASLGDISGLAAANETSRSPEYPVELLSAVQNPEPISEGYRRNSINKVYQLVMHKYRNCLNYDQSAASVDTYSSSLQNCNSIEDEDGSLGDRFGRSKNNCAIYRRGLQPWSEGILKESSIDTTFNIANIRCQHSIK